MFELWVGLVQCPCGVAIRWSSSLTCSPRLENMLAHVRLWAGIISLLEVGFFGPCRVGEVFGAMRTGEFRLEYRGVCGLAICYSVPPQAFPVTTKKFRLPASSSLLV